MLKFWFWTILSFDEKSLNFQTKNSRTADSLHVRYGPDMDGEDWLIGMQVVFCMLCGEEALRKLFLVRHWSKHNDQFFKGKPCEEYTFAKVKG